MMYFDPVAEVCVITMDNGTNNIYIFIYLYDISSIFSGIVWIDKLHHFHERICFPYNGCQGNRRKGSFSVIIATVTTEKNSFTKSFT